MATSSSRIKGITIEIDGNTTKLQDSLKQVNASIKNTQSALKDVESLLKFDPGNTTLLQQKQEYLAKAISETTEKLRQEKEALKQLEKSSDGNTSEQQKALQREIASTESYLKNLTNKQKEFGSVAKQQLLVAKEKMADYGKKITEVGKELSKLSAIIAGIGVAAVSAFKEVDAGADAIAKKTGATGEALEEMKSSMENIAKDMPVAFEETGDALGEINTRFHITGNELESLSRQFLKFAKINNVDVTTAIDTTQNALAAFNMDVGQASTLLDVLNKVSQNTGADVSVIANSLIENATALQEMGMNAYQAAEFMGALETAGADSVSVISGLKRALKSATDEGIPFERALEQMQDSILLNSDSMAGLNAAYDLFGKSGAAVYTAVKNGQIDFTKLADTTDILNDSLNSVNTTYETTLSFTDKWKVATNNLKIVLGDLGEALGEVLIPLIDKLVEVIQGITEWFNGLSDAQKQMIVVIGLVVAAIGPLIVALGTLTSSLGALNIVIVGTPVGWILAAIAAIVLAVVEVGKALSALYNNCDEFRNLVDEVAMQVQYYFSVLVDGIVQGTYDCVNTTSKLLNELVEGTENAIATTMQLPEKIKAGVDDMGKNISDFINNIVTAWKNFWTNLFDIARTQIKTLTDHIKNTFAQIRDFILYSIIGKIEQFWSNLWTNLLRYFIDKIVSIIEAIVNYFAAMLGVIKTVVNNIKQAWDDFWAQIDVYKEKAIKWGKDLVANMREGISGSISGLEKTLKKTAQTIKDYLGFSEPNKGPLSNFHTYMPDMMDLMIDGINDNLPRLEKASDKIASALVPNTNTDLQYDLNATTNASVGNLTSLFEDYLPVLASNQQVNVVLEGDAKGVFKLVKSENTKMIKSTGYHALA